MSALPKEERALFLDGIRGWAALMVVLCHFFYIFFPYTREDEGLWWLRFPCDGTLAVYIFFVLSGFALSTQFVKSKKREIVKSLALRRYFRLTIPILASVLMAYALMKWGFMTNGLVADLTGNRSLATFYNFQPSIQSALSFSFWDNYFRYRETFPRCYNHALWTMGSEMYGSFLVFILLLAFGIKRHRFLIYGILAITCLILRFPAMVAFLCGICLAEFYHSQFYKNTRNFRGSLIASITVLIAVWFYSTLHPTYPDNPLTLPFIASAVVLAVMINRRVLGAFESKGSLFMGHISFSLYLTHLLVICSVISSIYLVLNKAGYETQSIRIVTTLIVIPASLLMAWAFLPIEKLGIFLSKRIATAILCRKKGLA